MNLNHTVIVNYNTSSHVKLFSYSSLPVAIRMSTKGPPCPLAKTAFIESRAQACPPGETAKSWFSAKLKLSRNWLRRSWPDWYREVGLWEV